MEAGGLAPEGRRTFSAPGARAPGRRADRGRLARMAWVEVFAVFVVSHLVGDYVLQTDWQANHKRGGLGPDRESRRALASHILAYTLAYVPAFVWLAAEIGTRLIPVVALVAVPHWIQDDGRLVTLYIRKVKGSEAAANKSVAAAVDQSFHFVVLLATALVATS